ncbi:hypothetical protein Esti_002725 [Eimeria stiedai]
MSAGFPPTSLCPALPDTGAPPCTEGPPCWASSRGSKRGDREKLRGPSMTRDRQRDTSVPNTSGGQQHPLSRVEEEGPLGPLYTIKPRGCYCMRAAAGEALGGPTLPAARATMRFSEVTKLQQQQPLQQQQLQQRLPWPPFDETTKERTQAAHAPSASASALLAADADDSSCLGPGPLLTQQEAPQTCRPSAARQLQQLQQQQQQQLGSRRRCTAG